MTREEYMRRLEHRLRRLPKEDYNKAVSYFTEYFEDAGPDNEAQAIEDLGEPEMAADQIVREFAMENAKEPVKTVKRSFSAVWIGVLAVFAAPVALPLALAFGAVCLAFALVVIAFCPVPCHHLLSPYQQYFARSSSNCRYCASSESAALADSPSIREEMPAFTFAGLHGTSSAKSL